MSVRLRLFVIGTLAAVVALVTAGCSSPVPPGFGAPAASTQAPFAAADVTGAGAAGDGAASGGAAGGGSAAGAGVMNPDCMGVLSAYSTIALALLPTLSGGSGTYDAGQIAQAISGMGGEVPTVLKADFETLSAAAKASSGKSLTEAGQILGAPAVTAASDDITKWTDANCG